MRIGARSIVAICCASTLSLCVDALAVPFGFTRITSNGTVDPASQFSVDVTAIGSDDVIFTFTNTGSINSAIAGIYFDDVASDTILNSLENIYESSPAVDFSAGGSPSNLPGGSSLTNPFSANFRASANNPKPHRGVNPGEQVGLRYDLDNDYDFDDLIAALNEGSFRIGLHVISIGPDKESESYINVPGEPVPAPGAVLLGMIGLGGVPWARRRLG